MEVEERFGLKRRHTYDEIVAWLNSDPKGVPYPNRVAFQTYNSHIYGQLKDSLRNYTTGQDAWNAYKHATSMRRSCRPGRASKSHSKTLVCRPSGAVLPTTTTTTITTTTTT